MRLIFSFLAAIVGSSLGAGARVAVDFAAGGARADDGQVAVNGSIAAAGAGAILGTMFGGPRLAFWAAAVLSAAGAERFDDRVLSMAGVDRDELIARARELGERARQARAGATADDETAAA